MTQLARLVVALPAIFLFVPEVVLPQDAVELKPLVTSGLQSPLLLTHAGDGSGRLFVVEQVGRIRIIERGALLPTSFLDISLKIESGGEKGLLGLAFHPNFGSNRRFFVNYTRRVSGQLQSVVAEYRASAGNPNLADQTEQVVLQFDQPFENHNGGHLAFGPDGFLYIGTGDGGSGGDPQGNGQNLGTLLGKILRLDVNHAPYAVPADNPFVGLAGARPEIWAYGLRNPWRFTFDRLTGRMFLADVGQSSREEVDIIQRGGNYGWNRMEGSQCYPSSNTSCDRVGLILPISEYGRNEGVAVTGGYVNRGGDQQNPFWGSYLFGDFGTGTIWQLRESEPGTWTRTEVLRSGLNISSFGEDQEGNLYVVDLGGTIHQIRFPSRIVLAQAADGLSSGGNRFRTSVILVNGTDTEVRAEISFRSSSGVVLAVPLVDVGNTPASVVIPGRSSRSFSTTGSAAQVAAGWAEVKSDGPLTGSLLYGLYSPAGSLITEAGVDGSVAGPRLIAEISRDTAVGLDTALALVNSSSASGADVRISVTNRSGQEVGSFSLPLPPGNHAARFVNELIPLPARFEGTVLVTSQSGVAAVILRTQNGTVLSSLPVSR